MKMSSYSDLKKRIAYLEKLRDLYRSGFNERETQAYAVLPILRILGWDDSEVEEMKFEYPVAKAGSKKFVDIVLLLSGGNKIFIEAKAFQVSLKNKRPREEKTPEQQLFDYCKKASVRYGVLTNGCEWRFYEICEGAADYSKMELCSVINLIKDDRGKSIEDLNKFLKKERVEKSLEWSYRPTKAMRRLVTYLTENPKSTKKDVQAGLGLSPGGAFSMLKRAVEQGYAMRDESKRPYTWSATGKMVLEKAASAKRSETASKLARSKSVTKKTSVESGRSRVKRRN